MGAARVIAIIFLTIILIPFLILGNIFMSIGISYGPESIKENLESTLENFISEQISQNAPEKTSEIDSREGIPENVSKENIPEKNISEMGPGEIFLKQCESSSKINLMIDEVPCSEVEKDPEKAIGSSIEYIYEKGHDCSFIDCYQNPEDPSIIISEETNSNLTKISLIFAGIILLFFLLSFLAFKRKTSFMIYAGIILTIFSPVAPLIKNTITNMLSQSMPSGGGSIQGLGIFDAIKSIFFGKAEILFFIWLIIGVSLIVSGIIIKVINNNKKSKRKQRHESNKIQRRRERK